MTKRILVLNGHPGPTSLSRSLATAYADAAQAAGHKVRITHLADLDFDADFGFGGYRRTKPLEPPLEQFLADLEWAEHIVLTAPMWWGGLPAKLKGLIDRTFLPGRTFDTRRKTITGFPVPLLSGRSARLILTSDTPGWLMTWCYGNALFRQLKHQVFGFVGVTPMRVTHFIGASHPEKKLVERWRRKVTRLARAAA